MVGSLPTGRVSPQMSLQPSPMVKAAVKERSPCEEMAVFSTPSCELDMSTYGATCPTEALAGPAETIAVSIKPEATSSTEDPAATRRGLPRRLRTPIPTPSPEVPGKFLKQQLGNFPIDSDWSRTPGTRQGSACDIDVSLIFG